jgi:hypothetical protein
MSAAVGADIESICRKCGDVWHVVVAKVGDRIAKVQCKECGGLHQFRPAGSARAVAPRRRTATGSDPERQPPAVARIPKPSVAADLSRPVRTYSTKESFEPGDRIDHPTFGMGVVETIASPGKITVFFPEGQKVLACARPEPTLERRQTTRFSTAVEE